MFKLLCFNYLNISKLNSYMEIPIIIFHLGNQNYVKLCLRQAKKYNNKVILLNDTPNNLKHLCSNKCIIDYYEKYFINALKFQKIYKHFSTNSQQLELICIIRWMCIYEYMKEKKIKRAFICDSDVLIYDDISKINKTYLKSFDFMLCASSSKNLTGGQSIWDFNKLEEFVNFIFEFYDHDNLIRIENWWKNYKEPGGICDMTLLYYFANKSNKFVGLRLPDFPYFNQDLTQIFNDNLTFDLHLGTYGNHPNPEDYEINSSTKNKNIKFINKKPY